MKNIEQVVFDGLITLFAENKPVSQNALAKACGIRRSALYYHIRSKRQKIEGIYYEKRQINKPKSPVE